MTAHPDQPAGPEQPDPDLPIDGTQPEATQSMQMLMIASGEDFGLFHYRGGFDLRRSDQYNALVDTLGPDAVLPPRDGAYYLVYLNTGDEVRVPILIPEGQVRPFVFAFALSRGLAVARQLLYMNGLLPLPFVRTITGSDPNADRGVHLEPDPHGYGRDELLTLGEGASVEVYLPDSTEAKHLLDRRQGWVSATVTDVGLSMTGDVDLWADVGYPDKNRHSGIATYNAHWVANATNVRRPVEPAQR